MTKIEDYLQLAKAKSARDDGGKGKEKIMAGETSQSPLAEDMPAELDSITAIKPFVNAIDLKEYQQLLALTMVASEVEHAGQPQSVIDDNARLHAAKLILAFGKYKHALAYLKRFEKSNLGAQQLIHDACLFSMPSVQYNVKLWQALINKQSPSNYNDAVLRIFSLADQIEKYVQEHQKKLIAEIEAEVAQSFELRFSQAYDELKQSRNLTEEEIASHLKKQKKLLTRQAKKELDQRLINYAKEKLKWSIKDGNLSKDQHKQLNELKAQLHAKDPHFNINEIEKILTEQARKAFIKSQEQDALGVANQEKHAYVANQLKAAAGEMAAITRDKARHLLSEYTPITTLQYYAGKLRYARASEHPEAAELFFRYNVKEKIFNRYLYRKPQDDPKFIPDISIDGKDIADTYARYYLKKLPPSDPRAAILGTLTSCCQSLGDQGEGPTIHGITDPHGGFYVLCRRNNDKKEDDIVAQCWAWRGGDGNLVFDSLEMQCDFASKHTIIATDFYTVLANQLVTKHQVPQVLVGESGNTPTSIGPLQPFIPSIPVAYHGYRDSSEQRIIADVKSPLFIDYYLKHQSSSAMPKHVVTSSTQRLSEEQIKSWCALCAANDRVGDLDVMDTYTLPVGWYKKKINAYVQLNKTWCNWLERMTAEKLRKQAIEKFIKGGVNVNTHKSNAIPILHHAIKFNKSKIAKWLVEKGADINATNNNSESVLHCAVQYGELDTIKWLVEKGADINAKNMDALTVLHCAVEHRDLDTIKWLVEQGADVNVRDISGNTVLYFAAMYRGLDTIKWLVTQRTDINATNNNSESVLHKAAGAENWDTVEYLVEQGAHINTKNRIGNTVLSMAAIAEKWNAVKWLVGQGADINAENKYGDTALYLAAKKNKWDEVEWLAEQGAKINENTISLAKKSGKTTVAQWLRSKQKQQAIKAKTARLFQPGKSNIVDIITKLIEIINDTYWDRKGKSLIGSKLPAGIKEMRSYLKKSASNAKSDDLLNKLAKISKLRLSKDTKDRDEDVISLYSLIKNLSTNKTAQAFAGSMAKLFELDTKIRESHRPSTSGRNR